MLKKLEFDFIGEIKITNRPNILQVKEFKNWLWVACKYFIHFLGTQIDAADYDESLYYPQTIFADAVPI